MKVTPYALMYAPNFRWSRLDVKNSDGRAWIKKLGRDPENEACAALVRFDAGFSVPKSVSEVFSDSVVLDGKMRYGDRLCKKRTYFYRPAGTEYGPIKVEEDTTRFVMTGGIGEKGSGQAVFIDDVESNSPKWEPSQQGDNRLEKYLRIDKVENSFVQYHLVLSPLGFRPGRQWVHPAIEEAYMIEGECHDYVGEVQGFVNLLPGTYVYRPPAETWHGSTSNTATPRRLIVKYYDTDLSRAFAQKESKDIPQVSLIE